MGAFLMPSLGADMEAGTLVEWLKQPGEKVKRGDIVAVVETQKGAIEIEAFEEGVLRAQLVEIGKRVPVGTPLAMIGDGDGMEAIAPPATPVAAAAAPAVDLAEMRLAATPSSGRLRLSPAARRLAQSAGADPSTLSGSGPGGAILLADVAGGLQARPSQTPPVEPRRDMAAMRTAIAAAMARSKREIPHYYLSNIVDLTNAAAFVAARNAGRPPEARLLIGALLVKGVANALAEYPEFNGHFVDGVFRAGAAVHAGVAINIRGGGLVAPAIHDAGTLDLDALMAQMRDLVARVRAGRFRAAELADPTITVSSLGDRGVDALFGVIYPPQVAIVGFGTPGDRVVVLDGKAVVRTSVVSTLAADHRVSDGHRGSLFLKAIDRLLQQPEAL